MTPIQTAYKGYHFRSRLEARWAVFFDALGLLWEYEPEGFELPGGVRYLPDFRLTDWPLWVEIKGVPPNAADLQKARTLSRIGNCAVLVITGVPRIDWPKDFGTLFGFDEHGLPIEGGCGGFMQAEHGVALDAGSRPHGLPTIGPNNRIGSDFSPLRAIAAARSARFEHGHSGASL